MKGARVEYDWSYIHPTPFNVLDSRNRCTDKTDQIQKGSVMFKLHDDGWRIDKNQIMSSPNILMFKKLYQYALYQRHVLRQFAA
jgi:hypothetical protein